jgi:hypothetical protein
VEIEVRDALPEGARVDVALGQPAEYIVCDGRLRSVAVPERAGIVLRLSPAK